MRYNEDYLASSPLFHPHPAPGSGTLTQGRRMQFYASHTIWSLLRGSQGGFGPAPSCRGFPECKPGWDIDMVSDTCFVGTDVLRTPMRPSW